MNLLELFKDHFTPVLRFEINPVTGRMRIAAVAATTARRRTKKVVDTQDVKPAKISKRELNKALEA